MTDRVKASEEYSELLLSIDSKLKLVKVNLVKEILVGVVATLATNLSMYYILGITSYLAHAFTISFNLCIVTYNIHTLYPSLKKLKKLREESLFYIHYTKDFNKIK